jgi:hypothetical protein
LDIGDPVTRARGGFDLALECSGARSALSTALGAVHRESTVVSIGLVKGELPLDVPKTLISHGITTLRRSWGRSIWETWHRLTALVVAGKVDLRGLITHELPLGGLPEALDLMKGEAGKVLLDPSLRDVVPAGPRVPVTPTYSRSAYRRAGRGHDTRELPEAPLSVAALRARVDWLKRLLSPDRSAGAGADHV